MVDEKNDIILPGGIKANIICSDADYCLIQTYGVTYGRWSDIFKDNNDISHYDEKVQHFRQDLEKEGLIEGHLYVPNWDTINNDIIDILTRVACDYAIGLGADNTGVWLGSPDSTNNAYCVSTVGVDYCFYRDYSYAVAPAFIVRTSNLTDYLTHNNHHNHEKSYIKEILKRWFI